MGIEGFGQRKHNNYPNVNANANNNANINVNVNDNIKDNVNKGNSNGKSGSWAKLIYSMIGGLIILLLVVIPVYTLLIGYNGNVGVLMQIINGVDYTGNSSLADSSVLKGILSSIFGIITIYVIIFPPTEYLKSGIYASLMHIMLGFNTIQSTKNLKDNNPEEYNNLRISIGTYILVLLVIFVMYFSIIISLTQEIASGQGYSIIYILGILVKGLSIGILNTIILNMLDNKDPTPVYKKSTFVWTKEQEDAKKELGNKTNSILVGFSLLIINIIALGISSQISDFTTNQIENTGYSDIIEGQGSSSFDTLLNE